MTEESLDSKINWLMKNTLEQWEFISALMDYLRDKDPDFKLPDHVLGIERWGVGN